MKTNDKNDNIHKNHRERLQNTIFLANFETLSEIQILEYILTLCIPRIDTNPIAHRLLKEFDNIPSVLSADYQHLIKVDGVGPKTAKFLNSLNKFCNYYKIKKSEVTSLKNPNEIINFFKSHLEMQQKETFYMACLNAKCELIKLIQIGNGNINGVDLKLGEISENAIKYKASCVIIAHNHPDGNPTPSLNDNIATAKIMEALSFFNIQLIDHFIITYDDYYSFNQSGMLDEIKNTIRSKDTNLSNRLMTLGLNNSFINLNSND